MPTPSKTLHETALDFFVEADKYVPGVPPELVNHDVMRSTRTLYLPLEKTIEFIQTIYRPGAETRERINACGERREVTRPPVLVVFCGGITNGGQTWEHFIFNHHVETYNAQGAKPSYSLCGTLGRDPKMYRLMFDPWNHPRHDDRHHITCIATVVRNW